MLMFVISAFVCMSVRALILSLSLYFLSSRCASVFNAVFAETQDVVETSVALDNYQKVSGDGGGVFVRHLLHFLTFIEVIAK